MLEMSMELAAISAIAAVAGFGLAFATFWLTFGSRIATAETTANNAQLEANKATDGVIALTASFSLYREQIAREYIHREAMREVEDRLTAAIDRLGERLDRFIEVAAKAGAK
jgi:hypothetical protein